MILLSRSVSLESSERGWSSSSVFSVNGQKSEICRVFQPAESVNFCREERGIPLMIDASRLSAGFKGEKSGKCEHVYGDQELCD
eukprot:1113018-Rhodomonas_salina.4